MGDGVNIAARLESIATPGRSAFPRTLTGKSKDGSTSWPSDLGATQLKNIADPIRVYSLEIGRPGAEKGRDAAARPRDVAHRAEQARFAAARSRLSQSPSCSPPASRPGILSAVTDPGPSIDAAARGRAPLPRRAAVHQSLRRSSQDYFADGITENLTTDLSRLSGSFVIARNTAFTFKGKNIDAREIGKELGVRYVLEGSVQRDQNQVRVNAQLIDAESGGHLWAERFDKPLADLSACRTRSSQASPANWEPS